MKQINKIILVGWYENNWSTNWEMFRALASLGYTNLRFDYRKNQSLPDTLLGKMKDKIYSLLRTLDIETFQLGRLYYENNQRSAVAEDLLAKVQEFCPDLVIFSKVDTLDPLVIRKISRQTLTWYFFMDPLEIANKICISRYIVEAHFSTSSNLEVVDKFQIPNKKHFLLRQGVEIEKFEKANIEAEKIFDVVFVGSATNERKRKIRALRKAGVDVVCFGPGFENKAIYDDELVEVYSKARLILNLGRKGTGYSVRVVQALSTGTAICSDYSPELQLEFGHKKYLIMGRDMVDLAKAIHQFLALGDEQQNEIGKCARVEITSSFCWSKKLSEGLQLMIS